MNIQIFGTKKNFDSKKAERYFKERGIKYQFIDMKEKGLSKGEFQSVCQAIGGYDKLIDTDCKDKDLLALINNLPDGYRVIFNLYVIEGYQHEEIAAMLGIQPGTSRSQLVKARAMLQKQIIQLQKVAV